MPIVNVAFPDGTWLEGEEFCYPSGGMKRRAYARCADGQLRLFKAGIPDTFLNHTPCFHTHRKTEAINV